MDLVKIIYLLTATFPKSEMYSLTSQMQRSAVSIPSNVAEGYRRGSHAEFTRFLRIAYGSGGELETQIKIASMLEFGNKKIIDEAQYLLDEVMRLLNTMIKNSKSN